MTDHDAFRKMAANMLVVGFVKCWPLAKLAVSLGYEHMEDADSVELHKMCPFLPPEAWKYRWMKGRTQIRAFVDVQYPSLAAFLLANERKPERLAGVAEQVMRLAYRPSRKANSKFSDAERMEFNAAKKELRRVETANRAARRQQLSTQRGAWNVCK